MITTAERTSAWEWLYDKGNPVIRLWAAQRLGMPQAETERLRAGMLAHPTVQYWINCLLHVAEKPALHGSFDTCLENCMRKVLLFGVRERDDPRLAVLCRGALEKLENRMDNPQWMSLENKLAHPFLMNPVEYTILASWLAAMGHDASAISDTLQERLDSAHWFAANGEFDIHTDPAGFPTIPAARRSHPLIHPKFYPGNRYLYPLVYDLFAWANLPPALRTEENRIKLDAIMACVLDERYQRLPWGYGLIFVPPNKYYGMGWSVHLPRFFTSEQNRIPDTGAVWWAEAMASFPAATDSEWFQNTMEHLDEFRTSDGLWKFPAAYMAEAADKYFVGGGHMGLGESRKGGDGLKIESTVWRLRIEEKLTLASKE